MRTKRTEISDKDYLKFIEKLKSLITTQNAIKEIKVINTKKQKNDNLYEDEKDHVY